jgi:hypothetical protein
VGLLLITLICVLPIFAQDTLSQSKKLKNEIGIDITMLIKQLISRPLKTLQHTY